MGNQMQIRVKITWFAYKMLIKFKAICKSVGRKMWGLKKNKKSKRTSKI